MAENPFTDEHPGVCISCGLLSDQGPPWGPKELSVGDRRAGRANLNMACFRSATTKFNLSGEFNAEWTEPRDAAQRSEACLRVLKRKRGEAGCIAWIEYVPSFDPRWHYERWHEMELEDLRRKVMDDHKAIQEEHKAITDKLATIVSNADKSTTRFNLILIAVASLTLLVGVAGLVPVYDRLTGHEQVVTLATPAPQSTPRTAP